MNRFGVTVLVCFAACSPPSQIDAGVCPDSVTLGVLPRALAPAGVQTFWVGSDAPDSGPTVVTVSIGDASVGPQPINVGAFQLPVTTEGAFEVAAVASCGDRTVGTLSFSDRVYASIALARELPRECASLSVVDRDAGLLECDGVVIDRTGVAVSGFLIGDQTRVVGSARWVRNGNELRRGSAVVTFTNVLPWIASEDMSIAGNVAVRMLSDAGLERFEFDAGVYGAEPWAPCAAKNDVVAFCEFPASAGEGDPPTDFGFVSCSLNPNGLSGCTTRRALFIRQEPLSRQVLLRRDRQLFRIDLSSPAAEVPALVLRDREFLGSLSHDQWGTPRQPAVFHLGQVTPSGGFVTSDRVIVIEGDQRASGSADLVWFTDGGTTRWEWLP